MNSLSVKNHWLNLRHQHQLKTVHSQFLFSCIEVFLSEISTFQLVSWPRSRFLLLRRNSTWGRTLHYIALLFSNKKALLLCNYFQLSIFAFYFEHDHKDFSAFHSFQTFQKSRKGLPLFLALTLTFIVTDENIRPLLSVLLIISVSAANK